MFSKALVYGRSMRIYHYRYTVLSSFFCLLLILEGSYWLVAHEVSIQQLRIEERAEWAALSFEEEVRATINTADTYL